MATILINIEIIYDILLVCVVTERIAREREEEERHRLEEMSEDEYDALTEKDKADVDRKRLEIKKERIRK